MRRSLAAVLFGFVAAPLPGLADEVDALGGKVVEIEAQVRGLESELKPAAENLPGDVAERRLVDAQVLYELKNYEAASILLLDVVQKYETSSVYPEALFFLADSLYLKRDYLSSRRFFEKLVELGPQQRRYQETLQRLIELSLHTGDYLPVDGYLKRLSELPSPKQLPTVPYVKGKYYFFRQRYDEALTALKEIQPGHLYWFHAQYFLGATAVAKGNVLDAIAAFDGVLRAEAKTDSQKRITDLCHLALGRIYYDRGQFTNAEIEYGKVGQKSDYFAEALYEQAWVSIKSKDYKKAFFAFDLLLTAKPDDPIAPEVKLLVGNLHIRDGEYKGATESFNKTRDEFEPIYKKLDELVTKQPDLPRYFQDVVAKNLGKLEIETIVPPIAVKWVQSSPEMKRLGNVSGDVAELKKSLDEAEEILGRLDKAVTGPQKVNVFPELARARTKSIEAADALTDIRRQLLERERQIMAPVAGAERTEIDQLAAQRKAIEGQLADLPRSAESYEERLKRARADYDALDKRVAELKVGLQSYSAQRVAIEHYYNDTKKESKVTPEEDQRYQAEIAQYKGLEDMLRQDLELLRKDIAEASQSVGIDDAQMQQEARLKEQLQKLMNREHELSTFILARLSGPERARADQIESILSRAQSTDRALAGFNQRLDGQVEERLKDIRVQIAEEKAHVAEYRLALGGEEGETVVVGGGVTAEAFKGVTDRFYQIVVRADVGILDVGWALKQSRTEENQRLVREQKREFKLLDDEFKEITKE